jgi:4-alpha-glucanotransferase
MFEEPFELDRGAGRLPEPPASAVASVGTHDTPPFRALIDDDAEAEAWAKAVDAPSAAPRELLDATLGWLGASPARLVLVSLEDLWLERESQNRPGTATTENWSRKAAVTLEDLDARPDVAATVATVQRSRGSGSSTVPASSPARARTRRRAS